jgi:DmsE family decaheme c-type cytochrome
MLPPFRLLPSAQPAAGKSAGVAVKRAQAGPEDTPPVPPRRAGCHRAPLAAAFLAAAFSAYGQQAAAPAAPAPPATYVGSETCHLCHEDIFNAFQKNPHHLVETDKKYQHVNNACESCHGPGSKHAESLSAADIRQPAKLPPAETDRVCLSCHQNQTTHVGHLNSSHAKNQVSCTECHFIHKPGGLVARRAPDINQQCAGCHEDVWASFQQPYRHRLPEGVMSCVDCHNPHGNGNILPAMQQAFRGNEPGCFKCHGDLAAPFVYEHAPVRLEGCSACHQPHGSQNPRMLTRAQVQYVCLECHANLPGVTASPAAGPLGTVPPAFHDLRSPRFANCTTCHQKVHGSYVNRELLR